MRETRKKILDFLKQGRSAKSTALSLKGLLIFLTIFIGLGLILIALNGLCYLGESARGTLFIIWSIISAVVFVYWTIWPLIKKPGLRRIAILIEEKYPQLKSRLVSSFDLMNIDSQKLGYSSGLIDGVISDTSSEISNIKAKKIANYRTLRDKSAYLAIVLLLLCGFSLVSPAVFQSGLSRSMRPFEYIPRQTQTRLKTDPGDVEVTKYGELKLEITAMGKIPQEVFIYRSFKGDQAERGFQADRASGEDRKWEFVFEDIKRDFEYWVAGGDYISKAYHVRVLDKPRIVNLSLVFNYPDYTGRATQRISENKGSIDVPYGTYVSIEAKFSKEIKNSILEFADSSSKSMEIDDRLAKTSFRAIKSGSYQILASDLEGLSNDDPIRYPIRIIADEYPSVEITSPGDDIDLTDDMLLPLSIIAHDDYGFSKFYVAYIIADSEEDTNRVKIPFDEWRTREVSISNVWNLNNIDLLPEDVLVYWVEAYDNDLLTGPKMAKSKSYTARFPSIDEIISEVTQERERQTEDVEEISRKEQELGKELEEITRELKRGEEITYEQREDIREIMERQEKLVEQMDNAAQQYQETTEKMFEQQMMSSEIFEKLTEIQKLMEQIATEEMRKAMEELQKALDSMDPEQLRKAAEQFEMSQNELMERLDRTLSLLKRIQVEQRVSDMKALSEKLKEMEDQVKEGLESGEMSQQEAKRMQDRITEGSELLEKGLEELAYMMSEFPDMPSDKAQELSEQTQQNSPSNKSKQCKNSMNSGDMKSCKSKAGELSEQFEDISEQLAQLEQDMQSMMSEEVAKELRKAVFSLLDISARQERLIEDLGLNPRDRDEVRSMSQVGADLYAALARVTGLVMEIARKNMMISPNIGALLGNALMETEQMLLQMEQGRGYAAQPRGEEALARVNVAAEKLLETMEQMGKSGSCSGSQSFFQQMQSMCNKQGEINAGTIPLAGGQGQSGGSMSLDQQAAAARMAAEQDALKKSMEELAKEAEEQSNIAGRMDDIVEEMEQVVRDLRSQNVDERTLKYQERILGRMLDVQKSLHKREFEDRRISKTGEEKIRRGPDDLPEDLGERRDLLQQKLLRALNQPYPDEYETEIKAYFRSLRETPSDVNQNE